MTHCEKEYEDALRRRYDLRTCARPWRCLLQRGMRNHLGRTYVTWGTNSSTKTNTPIVCGTNSSTKTGIPIACGMKSSEWSAASPPFRLWRVWVP